MKARARKEALSLLGEEPVLVDEAANFFGLESRGKLQWRGNGCLALSDDALGFAMWLPRRSFAIQRGSIETVDEAASHLGKWVGQPLLRVRFTSSDGEIDTAAWWVRELPRWLAALG